MARTAGRAERGLSVAAALQGRLAVPRRPKKITRPENWQGKGPPRAEEEAEEEKSCWRLLPSDARGALEHQKARESLQVWAGRFFFFFFGFGGRWT